jgi:hypothetical protein
VVSKTYKTKEQLVSTTCVYDDYVDLAQYNSCIQTTVISTKETLFHIFAQIMLENTSIFIFYHSLKIFI